MLMNTTIKIQSRDLVKKALLLLCLIGTLLMNNCKCNQNNPSIEKLPDPEVIVFLGNPGAGKSTLCNSIFGQAIFQSGFSLEQLTTRKQEYIHENRRYIDTPSLACITVNAGERAADEIEKALKHSANYKIIFVILGSAQIIATDLVSINMICETIQAPFEYGIIFNQLNKRVTQVLEKDLDRVLKYLNKKPSSILLLERDDQMVGEDNVYFPAKSESREKLVNFVAGLKASKIHDQDVTKINIADFQKKVEEMQLRISADNN